MTKAKSPSKALMPSVLYEAQSDLSRQLILLEEVRAALQAENITDIDLPGIVVCGDQSAGKSSVLESLTGISFPRSEHTCTRCPAIVRLMTDPSCKQPYALIGSDASFKASTRVEDFDAIEDEIKKVTDALAGNGGLISRDAIHILVVRPEGPMFTLIDLPGITHNVPDGSEEQQDIYEVTTALVREYIKNDRMVILVVIPADSDFQNAAAIKLARKYDKEGKRTLGVVTKCDKVANYDDIVGKIHMTGKNLKLRLGFVAVRNRTNQELLEGLSLDDARHREEETFKNHAQLSKIDKDRVGVKALSKRIVDLQRQAMNGFFPQLARQLRTEIRTLTDSLNKLKPACNSDGECMSALHQVLDDIKQKFSRLAEGSITREETAHNICARSSEASQVFDQALGDKLPDFFHDDMAARLEKELKETQGTTLPNFVGGPAVGKVAVEVITHALTSPSQELTSKLAWEIVAPTVDVLVNEATTDYPNLTSELQAEFRAYLEDVTEKTDTYIQALIDAEAYVGTSNSRYTWLTKEASHRIKTAKANWSSDPDMVWELDDCLTKDVLLHLGEKLAEDKSNHRQALIDMQVSLYAYCKVVVTTFSDSAFKQARLFLIKRFQENMVSSIKTKLLGEENIMGRLRGLMQEDSIMAEDRHKMMTRLETFRKHLPKLEGRDPKAPATTTTSIQ